MHSCVHVRAGEDATTVWRWLSPFTTLDITAAAAAAAAEAATATELDL